METLKVDILNPKARKQLKDMAESDLITIRKSSKSDFSEVLKKLRAKYKIVPRSLY